MRATARRAYEAIDGPNSIVLLATSLIIIIIMLDNQKQAEVGHPNALLTLCLATTTCSF